MYLKGDIGFGKFSNPFANHLVIHYAKYSFFPDPDWIVSSIDSSYCKHNRYQEYDRLAPDGYDRCDLS